MLRVDDESERGYSFAGERKAIREAQRRGDMIAFVVWCLLVVTFPVWIRWYCMAIVAFSEGFQKGLGG